MGSPYPRRNDSEEKTTSTENGTEDAHLHKSRDEEILSGKWAHLHCFAAEYIDAINSKAARARDASGYDCDLSIFSRMAIRRPGNRALPACALVEFC
jgi:hypothetical protein